MAEGIRWDTFFLFSNNHKALLIHYIHSLLYFIYFCGKLISMETEKILFEKLTRMRALAQNGLVYANDEYDIERYNELLELCNSMTAELTENNLSTITNCFIPAIDYVTPKVDIRAVIFNDSNEILLVQEKADGKWSLPGGWADVGFSPTEVAIKEVKEETGLDVTPVRLLAVIDKRCHPYPPALHYAYKLFILCKTIKGGFNSTFDILDKGYFGQNALPPLSEERVIKEHIDLMFEYKKHPEKEVVID